MWQAIIAGVDRLLAAAWRLPLTLRVVAVAAVCALLWWSSSMPREAHAANALRAFAHNGAHVIAFGVLAIACWMLRTKRSFSRCGTVSALGAAILYGLVDELHQRHIPGRSCSVVDLVSDGVGAGLAVTLLQWRLELASSASRYVIVMAALAIASVSLATWGPW